MLGQDWLALAGLAIVWGSSFLFIRLAANDLAPTVLAWGRVAFGLLALSAMPTARRLIGGTDRRALVVVSLTWFAIPFALFGAAERSIDSSLAGLLNAGSPLFTLFIGAAMIRRWPNRRQLIGVAVGLAGVVAITAPSVHAGSEQAVGVAMVVAATACYGLAWNLLPSLQQRHSAPVIIWNAQLVALLFLTPFALTGLGSSSITLRATAAELMLGVVCTAAGFVVFTQLAGRVGSARASLTTYFVPLVAALLGAALLAESLTLWALLGGSLVLAGAWLARRN